MTPARSADSLLVDLTISADGWWEGCALAVCRGIITFLDHTDIGRIGRAEMQQLQALLAAPPSKPDLEAWFDEAYPAAS